MLEADKHRKFFKICAILTIGVVIIFFLFIPVAMLGPDIEFYSDSAADSLDSIDGNDTFTPGKTSNQTLFQKIQSSF